MSSAVELAQVWRGDLLESIHMGHAVICNGDGEVVDAWGDPALVMYPRSSCKMIQALPLVESGIALSESQLALACASHNGAGVHVDMVGSWLGELGLAEHDMRCGSHMPKDEPEHHRLIRAGEEPCQLHNNCSGKHAGFLALNQHLGGGSEYVDPDHPVQVAVRAAFEDMTGEDSPGYGIDGCSAPNFATSLTGLARAMGFFASAHRRSGARAEAATRLTRAMATHPLLVAGEGRACTELMRAMGGRVAIKTGAEAVFVAILPEQELGIALKVVDGGTRGAECAIAALLIRAGVLDAGHPAVAKFWNAPMTNCRGKEVGFVRPGSFA
ncbi:asparaginase [Pseudooceanicola onchidii]|uniref:asparaginase n=1 Tax=Pseudooceanicola onchidii TaxID=2562279 RepID=UPI0010A9A76A|nr:asparaginase [Pseudooceanicola onchidii]